MFSPQEQAYLLTQMLARLGTVAADGQPDVDVVGFQFDGTHFYIGGYQLTTTRKYKNIVAGNPRVSLIIDDLKSRDPWTPRAIKIHGTVSIIERDEGHLGHGFYIAITPSVSWSWGVDEPEPGKFSPHKIIWS